MVSLHSLQYRFTDWSYKQNRFHLEEMCLRQVESERSVQKKIISSNLKTRRVGRERVSLQGKNNYNIQI